MQGNIANNKVCSTTHTSTIRSVEGFVLPSLMGISAVNARLGMLEDVVELGLDLAYDGGLAAGEAVLAMPG
eukprot:SAG22_NODE_577_length_8975_cov_12.406827_13_plen_71_part_00